MAILATWIQAQDGRLVNLDQASAVYIYEWGDKSKYLLVVDVPSGPPFHEETFSYTIEEFKEKSAAEWSRDEVALLLQAHRL